MAAGHSASQAEALAAQCPGWRHAPSAAIDVFALASTRLYNEIARNDPQPFKQRLAAVAHDWACHRLGLDRYGGQATSPAAGPVVSDSRNDLQPAQWVA